MFSAEFWAENWIKLLFGLLSSGILAYLGYVRKKLKEYRNLRHEDYEERLESLIQCKIDSILKPVQTELDIAKEKFEVIKDSYRYRLIALCEIYLNRGYLTPQEYHQISEMWKVYHGLGGNSQAEDYYHKVEKLPVRDH